MKKFSLKDREWKEFKIGNIFSVSTGALLPKEILRHGIIPRISATENNNGVAFFCGKANHKNYRELTNFISVSFLGGVFYHPYNASLDMKIHALQIPHMELNRYVAEFLVLCLKKMTLSYSYGNQLSSTDLPQKRIMLPVTCSGAPDYAFMEKYMCALESQKLTDYKAFMNMQGGGG